MVRAPTRVRPAAASTELGFSLVELIVVIVITGIIASVVGLFITGPIMGFLDQARRAELVDSAQLAMTRMGRDLRGSLPNSVRISGDMMELLLTLDGERYRTELPGSDLDRLDFTNPLGDASFNTLEPLSAPDPLPPLDTPYTVTGALAIYPLQQTLADPYVAADRVMTATLTFDITPKDNNGQTEYRVTLPTPHQFPFESPTHRVFLVSGPVTYRCNPPQLLRYDGYTVTATQGVPPVTPVVISGNVQSCVFQYSAGTAQRNAVVSVALAMAVPSQPDERVRLLRQVYVGNSP